MQKNTTANKWLAFPERINRDTDRGEAVVVIVVVNAKLTKIPCNQDSDRLQKVLRIFFIHKVFFIFIIKKN